MERILGSKKSIFMLNRKDIVSLNFIPLKPMQQKNKMDKNHALIYISCLVEVFEYETNKIRNINIIF